MRLRLSVPDELNDAERQRALNAALEATTITNAALVRAGKVPPAADVIRAKRVRWQPEPPGDEHFDIAPTVIGRGWGDCDDLAPWHAGSLRASGVDPNARAFVKRSGPKRWHALVMRSDGRIEDPSRAAGMGHSVSGAGDAPAFQRPMSADRKLCLAICPSRDPRHPLVWFTRIDAPDVTGPFAWSSVATHPEPRSSLVHAIKTVRSVAGDEIDESDDLRLAVMEDLVSGVDPFEVAEALEEVVGDEDEAAELFLEGCEGLEFLDDTVGSFGSFFRKIGRGLGKVFKPIASVVLPAAGSLLGPLGTAAGGALAAAIPSGGGGGNPQQIIQQALARARAHVAAKRAAEAAAAQRAAPAAPRPFVPSSPRIQVARPFGRPSYPFPGAGGFPFGGMQPPWGYSPPYAFPFGFPQQQQQRPPTVIMEPGHVMRTSTTSPAFMRF